MLVLVGLQICNIDTIPMKFWKKYNVSVSCDWCHAISVMRLVSCDWFHVIGVLHCFSCMDRVMNSSNNNNCNKNILTSLRDWLIDMSPLGQGCWPPASRSYVHLHGAVRGPTGQAGHSPARWPPRPQVYLAGHPINYRKPCCISYRMHLQFFF